MTLTRVTLGTLLLLVGCGRGPTREHTNLTDGAEPLRSAFNADSGAVRAIYLASPT